MIQEIETFKYRKQKESSVSKSKAKSNHKHQYEECLLQYEFDFLGKDNINTTLSSYCTICGKIGNRFKKNKSIVKDYIREVDIPNGKGYKIMKGKELYEKYHNKLPVFFIGDSFVKYVSMEKET